MNSNNLSCVILSRCEKTLKKSISSVTFCDEIIVILDKDKKCEGDFPKNVLFITHPLQDNFSQQRNFGLKTAKNRWVLFLDSDEIVTPELKQSILRAIKTDYSGFYIKRKEFVNGKELKYGEILKARKKGFIRLVKKGEIKFEGRVHERTILPRGVRIAKIEKGAILHNSHQNIAEFLKKINYYSSLRALELKEKGKKFNLLILLSFPILKFIYTYFILLGFLDGYWGFVYSFMMSFHSFLVRAKLFTDEVKR